MINAFSRVLNAITSIGDTMRIRQSSYMGGGGGGQKINKETDKWDNYRVC